MSSAVADRQLDANDKHALIDNCASVLGVGANTLSLRALAGGENHYAGVLSSNNVPTVFVKVTHPHRAVDGWAKIVLLMQEVSAHCDAVLGPHKSFASPAFQPWMLPSGRIASFWECAPAQQSPTTEAQYKAFGYALRLFHQTGKVVVQQNPQLRPVKYGDINRLYLRLDEVSDQLNHTELKVLRNVWDKELDKYSKAMDLYSGPTGVIHDDALTKNALICDGKAKLVDFDNTAWGPVVHDLGFLVRACDRGELSKSQLNAFQAGYGEPLPTTALAEVLAIPHKLGWSCDLAARRRTSPHLAAMFDKVIAENSSSKTL